MLATGSNMEQKYNEENYSPSSDAFAFGPTLAAAAANVATPSADQKRKARP
jgi:hypothetical protein